MKKIFALLSLIAAAVILQACTSADLTIYLPNDYISKDVVADFERLHNVKVKIINFDSNEVALGRIMTNSYDVVIPSEYAIEELASGGYLETLDWSLIDFDKNNDFTAQLKDSLDGLASEGFDLLSYGAPYFWGTVGVLYNNNKVTEEMLINANGFGLIADPSLNTILYDSSRDAFMAALVTQDPIVRLNSATQANINSARDWLVTAVKQNNTKIQSDEILSDLLNGTPADAVIAYSGDAVAIMAENDNYSFFVPKQTNSWVDGMAIPKNAKNKELAYEFISFMLSEEAALASTLEIGYSSPVQTVFDQMIGEDGEFNEPRLQVAYSPTIVDPQFFRYNPALKEMISVAWSLVIAS